MNEQTDNTQPAQEAPAEQAANTNTADNKAKTPAEQLQAVSRKYFNSSAMAGAQDAMGAVLEICAANGLDPVLNFNPDEEFPETHGLAIIPLTERVEGFGNVTKGVAFAAIPDFEAVIAKPEGQAFVRKQLLDCMVRQVSSSCKQKEGQLTSIPLSVLDFCTSSRSSGLAGFNHVATLFVKALKKKGLKLMSKALLRQILASASFAEQQYPRLPQANWVAVLNSMVSHAEKDSIDVSGLRHWVSTRDTETIDMKDVDLTDIDSLV